MQEIAVQASQERVQIVTASSSAKRWVIASSGIGSLGISWESSPALTEVEEVIASHPSVMEVAVIGIPASRIADQMGNIRGTNMVLLGALIQTGILPLTVDQVKAAMHTKTKKAFLDSNLKAFDLGYSAAESA